MTSNISLIATQNSSKSKLPSAVSTTQIDDTIVDIREIPYGFQLLIVQLRILEDTLCLEAIEISILRVQSSEDVPVLALFRLGYPLLLRRRHVSKS
jgi:hypothetical protein